MRKEAVNTFTEGLIKDLHPLNTPANVLTDALNATLVTYDGNEFILQNDVGNGRVETARLPSGYIPVGVTEYGGIIYVASYNPLTGKSQLGSFPSPERQISTEELGKRFGISTNINTNNAYVRLDIYDESKSDLYRLNPGDKFILASSGISNYFSSVYKGILEIHIGIVDKENNITYIEDDLTEPYILDTNNIETNTNWQVFTSKTSGYLTIIVELLSIDTFNVSRDISLLSVDNGSSKTNTNPKFGVTFNGNYTTSSNIRVEQFKMESNMNSSPIYSTTSLKLGMEDFGKTDVLNYTITPICKYGELSSFASSGIIDFSTLGTGYCKLTDWKYYVDNNSVKLTWGLDFDPVKYLKVRQIKFTFFDLQNGLAPVKFAPESGSNNAISYYTCGYKDNYNGTFMENIPFQKSGSNLYGVLGNRAYFVTIDIEFVNKSNHEISPMRYCRMLFTTGIFNQQFVEGVVKDFKELNYPANFTISATSEVTNSDITPSDNTNTSNLLDQLKGDEKVSAVKEVVYSVNSEISIEAELINDKSFGKLNYKVFLSGDSESTTDYGLAITVQNITNDDVEVTGTGGVGGNSLENMNELDTMMKTRYPNDKNPMGTVDTEKIKIERSEDIFNIIIPGYIRRGIISSGSIQEETSVKGKN